MRLSSYKLLYFGKLYAQTAQLDLTVKSAENKDIPVFIEFCIVACTVHSLTIILYKCLCCFFGKITVSLCHTDTADIKLSGYTEWRRIAVFVNNYLAVVKKRSAYSNIFCIGQIGGITGDCYFSRAVGVDYPDSGRTSHDSISERYRIAFASRHNKSAFSQLVSERLIFHILLKTRRSSVHTVNSVLLHQPCKQTWIIHFILRSKHKSFTVAERSSMLLE